MAYPRFRLARSHRYVRYTGGTISVPTAMARLSASVDDIPLEAQEDDVIEVGLNARWNNGNDGYGYLDVVALVAAAPTRYLSTDDVTGSAEGVPGWQKTDNAGDEEAGLIGPPMMFTLAATDIVDGVVTLRLYGDQTGVNSALVASAAVPFFWYAKNLGPQDPE